MEQIAIVPFIDAESGDDGFILVRAGTGIIDLTISLHQDGDVMALLSPEVCLRVIEALQAAVQQTQLPDDQEAPERFGG